MKTELNIQIINNNETSVEIDQHGIEVDCNTLEKMVLNFTQAKEILALLPC